MQHPAAHARPAHCVRIATAKHVAAHPAKAASAGVLPAVSQVDWETMWRERLTDYARPQEGKSALGWSTKVTVEVWLPC